MNNNVLIGAIASTAIAMMGTSIAKADTHKTTGMKEKPNIVLMLIDDMGYSDITCNGSNYHRTPHIDALAESGIRFTNGYSACTVSSPTRAALMTGKYPARLHVTDWIPGQNHKTAPMSPPQWCKYLPEEEITIAEVLRDNGYKTWHVGKWHLDGKTSYTPEIQGFDVAIGVNTKGDDLGDYSPKKQEKLCKKYFPPYCLTNLPDGPSDEYLTDRLSAEAVSLIKQSDEEPFFLYFAHYAVHTPLMAKPDLEAKYKGLIDKDYFQQNATYAAMVESVDQSVAQVVAALKDKGKLENTIFIFVSDNGALCQSVPNNPFRAGKGSAYEGGVRVPMIVSWPGHIKPNTLCDYPAITMDITATLMDIVNSPQIQKIDGISLLPALKGTTMKERPLYWHYPHNHRGGSLTYSAIRLGDWRLVEHLWNNQIELYNLKEDVSEQYNLVESNSKQAQKLYSMLKKWREKVDAQMPVPNPNYKPQKTY